MTPTDKKNRKRPTKAQEGPSLAERLSALHSSMGLPAAMARHRMEDPVAKALDDYDAQRAAALTEKRKARAQARALRSTEIIEDEFNKLREKHPDHDFKTDGPWKTGRGRELRRAVKQRREQEESLQPYKPEAEADTIGRCLAKLPIFSDWKSNRRSD
jgi:hypothetical protein